MDKPYEQTECLYVCVLGVVFCPPCLQGVAISPNAPNLEPNLYYKVNLSNFVASFPGFFSIFCMLSSL